MSETLTIGARSESSGGDYVLPEEGEYIGEFLGWTDPMQSKHPHPKTGEVQWIIQLRYRLTDFEDDPQYEIKTRWFDPSKTRGKVLEENLKALLQRDRDDDETVDLAELVGRQVRIFVFHHKDKDKDGNDVTYANIDKVLSAAKRKPKAAVAEDDFPE